MGCRGGDGYPQYNEHKVNNLIKIQTQSYSIELGCLYILTSPQIDLQQTLWMYLQPLSWLSFINRYEAHNLSFVIKKNILSKHK